MSKIRFVPIDLSAVANPPVGTAYLAIDLDGNLKTKDDAGNITQVGSNPKESQVIYVDANYGDDSTGLVNDPGKPFLTLNGALGAASSGDTIVVRRGSYSQSGSIAMDSVNWYFMPDTFVSGFGNLFDDLGSDMTFSVYGHLVYQMSGVCLNVAGANSNIYMEFDRIESGSIGVFTNTSTTNNTIVTIKGNSIYSSVYAMSIRGGAQFKGYISKEIHSNNTTLNLRNCAVGYNFYLECPNIHNDNIGGIMEVLSVGNLTTGDFDIHIKGNLISNGTGSSGFQFCTMINGGRVLIEGDLISESKPALTTLDSYGGHIRIKGNVIQKSGDRETISSGSSLLNVIVSDGEIYNGGYNNIIDVGIGTYFAQVTSSNKLLLKNCTMHNDGGDYVGVIEGTSNVFTAYGCTLYSNLESIFSTTPQNINFYNCVSNVIENANITQLEAGGLVTNSNVILYNFS